MNRTLATIALLSVLSLARSAPPDGFVPMFNGKDLSGWLNVNCHPGTFFVKGDEVITTGKPTGYMRTTKQYQNFVLEVDWMHVNTKEVGNSGIFVWGDPLPAVGTGYTRGIEVQVLVNLTYKDKEGRVTASSHGDLFSIWGAKCTPDRPHPSGWERCLPSENRAKGGGEWNHYKVTANDGVIKLEVNGKEVSGVSKCNPRKGYLALESEGAECHFKNLKIKELPSTNPKPEECAKVDEGFVSLFDGLDLDGWKPTDAWQVRDGVVKARAKTELTTKKTFGPLELQFDCRTPPKSKAEWSVRLGTNRTYSFADADADGRGNWNRVVLTVGKDGVSQSVNGRPKGKAGDVPDAGPVVFAAAQGLELRSIFLREIKEK
jgi:3-keto-disaccharide hydrolase